nr:MAG TPA: hypothetical protein [Caudoviricetes sp.]
MSSIHRQPHTRSGFRQLIVCSVPRIDYGTKQVELVLAYLLSILGEVKVCILPVIVILISVFTCEDFFRNIVHARYFLNTEFLNGRIGKNPVKARRRTIQSLYNHAFKLFDDPLYRSHDLFEFPCNPARCLRCLLCFCRGIGGCLCRLFRYRVCRLLGCQSLRCCICSQLAQQTDRSRYQFFATHCRECLYTIEA